MPIYQYRSPNSRKILALLLPLILLLIFPGLPGSEAAGAPPKNVIFMIGDGMGFEQVKAAGMYLNGAEGTLSFESLPFLAEMTTHSANSSITDSAAAATAIATGVNVDNNVVSVAIPGDGHELETLLEYFKTQGKRTGMVTTTNITHATPACFGAHETDRSNYAAIAIDYLNQTRPNVLLGGGGDGMSVSSAQTADYTVVTNATGILAMDTDAVTMVSGQFGTGHMPYEYDGLGNLPHLLEMTETALDVLDNDPNGFFLMVEGGRIDHACHANDMVRSIFETIEFAESVQAVIDWGAGRADTLILVTADHETGGLIVISNNGIGKLPTVSWSTTGHTDANVPVYAWGVNAEMVDGVMDNTGLFDVAVSGFVYSGDFDEDGDTDGFDLYKLVIGEQDLGQLNEFALVFGSGR